MFASKKINNNKKSVLVFPLVFVGQRKPIGSVADTCVRISVFASANALVYDRVCVCVCVCTRARFIIFLRFIQTRFL